MEAAYGLRDWVDLISADHHVGNADFRGVAPGWRASGRQPTNAQDVEFLRAFPKLERLSFNPDPKMSYLPDKTAAEFWKEYDAKKYAAHFRFVTGAAAR